MSQPLHVTGTYMVICLLLFLAVDVSISQPHWDWVAALIYNQGVFSWPDILAGQWWRLLTCHFLHASWAHLLNNMIGMWIYGSMLEQYLVPSRMVVLILMSMAATDAATVWFANVKSLGASGVVYGLLAAFVTLAVRIEIHRHPDKAPQSLRTAVVYGVILVALNIMGPENVNIWGHFGGFAAGLLFGLLPVRWLAPQ